jgi:hypothetical protein
LSWAPLDRNTWSICLAGRYDFRAADKPDHGEDLIPGGPVRFLTGPLRAQFQLHAGRYLCADAPDHLERTYDDFQRVSAGQYRRL